MNLQTFLAQAVLLERESEDGYALLVELTKAKGDLDASAFFSEMVGFSRMHRETAMSRAGFASQADVTKWLDSQSTTLPEGATELPMTADVPSPVDLDAAMSLTLAAEKRGVVFYENVAANTNDAEIRTLAQEFATEERSHVLALERYMGLQPY